MKEKAVVLLSGGLDSTTTLYLAKKKYQPYCLIFDYDQRHRREISSAKTIAEKANCPYRVIKFNLPWSRSSLTDKFSSLPQRKIREIGKKNIPSTYVPARNTIFLSFALSYAESIGAGVVFIGANSLDFSGYPDCRPEYYTAFRKVGELGTKIGTEGRRTKIFTPLIKKSKAEIIKLAVSLKVPLELTWSCYQGGKDPCGKCDSCLLRAKGFREAGLKDPSAGSGS